MKRPMKRPMKRRDFTHAFAAATAAPLLGFGSTALAQGASEGKDFTRVGTPQPAGPGGKVEVIEFFSYACPHCNEFEPGLEAWAKTLPPHATLTRVPVPFLAHFENFQRAYYAFEAMGLVDAMQLKVFHAVHVERQRFEKPEEFAALVKANGGDAARFLDIFKSFSIVVSTNRAKKLTADYKIDTYGVPALLVQRTYLTSPAQVGNTARALAVVNELIKKVHGG